MYTYIYILYIYIYVYIYIYIYIISYSLTLIWVGKGGNFTSCWFFLNNSKTVKAVTLEFCSIQEHSIRDILAKFGIHNVSQSPDIGQDSDKGISDIHISGLSVIKQNCHNFPEAVMILT